MSATKAKIVAICVTMVITVISFVCSTFAYFTDSVTSSGSMIAAGKAEVEIIDITYPFGSDVSVPPGTAIRVMPGYEIRKQVVVRNTGDYPLYVRLVIDFEIMLAEENLGRESEIDPSLVGCGIDTENWIYHTDGYYYYRAVLGHGNETPSPFDKVTFSKDMGELYENSTILLNARVEVVQAQNNGTSAFDAVGWTDPPLAEGGDA